MTQSSLPAAPLPTSAAPVWAPRRFVARLLVLALLFFIEKLFLDQFVDFDLADASQGLGATIRAIQHWLFRFCAVFGASLLVFALARTRAAAQPPDANSPGWAMLRAGWVIAHILLLALLAGLCHSLYRATPTELSLVLITTAGVVVGCAAVLTAFLALAPTEVWLADCRSLGAAWLYAALIAGIGTSTIGLLQSLWRPASALTFYLVEGLLRPVLPALQADPTQLILDTGRFAIQVADACSGLEGVGLMLAFSALWLFYFRREYRFPRSLWIVPLGVMLMFALNALRIATLLLIGHAGYPEVALFGFHSQAGWIAFVIGASAVVLMSRRPAFLRREFIVPAKATVAPNLTAAYLSPLLVMLAAGMLSRALSGPSQALYPLGVLSGLAALGASSRALWRRLDWHVTWRAPLAGALVGGVTVLAIHGLHLGIDAPRAGVTLLVNIGRCFAALAVLPLAEELAYRGFLMRRLVSADFDSIPLTAVGWPAVCAAAILSAAIQGALFVPGIVAGVVYGALAVRQGRLAEAIVAHAVANAAVIVAEGPWAPY